jgi:hypothetical protein
MSKPKTPPKRAIAIALTVPKIPPGGVMKKEIGLPKSAPKAAKKADDKMDKAKGIHEGSAKDLAADKKIMKSYGKKGK